MARRGLTKVNYKETFILKQSLLFRFYLDFVLDVSLLSYQTYRRAALHCGSPDCSQSLKVLDTLLTLILLFILSTSYSYKVIWLPRFQWWQKMESGQLYKGLLSCNFFAVCYIVLNLPSYGFRIAPFHFGDKISLIFLQLNICKKPGFW